MWVPILRIFKDLHNFIPTNHPTETLWATGLLTQTKVSFLLAGLRLLCTTQYHSDYICCCTRDTEKYEETWELQPYASEVSLEPYKA